MTSSIENKLTKVNVDVQNQQNTGKHRPTARTVQSLRCGIGIKKRKFTGIINVS